MNCPFAGRSARDLDTTAGQVEGLEDIVSGPRALLSCERKAIMENRSS
jgi:hypothetical protein